uniref:Uncharacterized protein n=1 Tax=Heterorhabditis bacteriophora TaxID=37862 RepID=A0A1I7XNM0_HETBA
MYPTYKFLPTPMQIALVYQDYSNKENKYKWPIEIELLNCDNQPACRLQYTFVIALVLLGLWTTLQLFIHIETIAVIENEAGTESEEEQGRDLLQTLFNDLYSEEEQQDVEDL